MKLIDFTKNAAKENQLESSLEQIRGKLPFLGKSSAQVKEMILARFQRGLDNRFTMIQNFTPEGQLKPIPFILVGPPGVAVINLNMEKGVYRIKEETWHELNKGTRKFTLARVNLVKQTQMLCQTVSAFLTQKGQTVAEVMPILLFADPGVHVDQNRPAIRLVLADGIDRLIASLVQANETLNPMEVKGISDVFDNIAHPLAPITATEEDFFGKDLGLGAKKAKPKTTRPVPELNLDMPPAVKRLRFTRTQWIILGAIVALNILILMGAILVVIFLGT
jgi:hypothetical protein